MPQDDRTEMWARQIYGLLMISDQQEKTYWSAWGEYEKNNSILIIGNKEVYMSSKKHWQTEQLSNHCMSYLEVDINFVLKQLWSLFLRLVIASYYFLYGYNY